MSDEQTMTKLPPQVWAVIHGYVILDPDGWRTDTAPEFTEPITEEQFRELAPRCTVAMFKNANEVMRDYYLSRVERNIRLAKWD